MERKQKMKILGFILILTATMGWGASFTILQDVIDDVSMFYVMGLRFLSSTLFLILIFFKKFKGITKGTIIRGLLLGASLTLAYLTQTIGLKHTTPGENAFLTSTYNIICPFLIWFVYKTKPHSYHVIASILCVVGVGLIALSSNAESNGNAIFGYFMTILSAIFFAFQIVITDIASRKKDDSIVTLIFELGVAGVFYTIISLIVDLPKGISVYALNLKQILMIAFLTLVCTLYGQFAQIIGIKYLKPSKSAILLSLESVFGTIFSLICGREKTSPIMFVGFAVIFVAVLFSELKIQLFKKKKNDFIQ